MVPTGPGPTTPTHHTLTMDIPMFHSPWQALQASSQEESGGHSPHYWRLADTPPEEVPKESKFLLEINFGKLPKSHIKNQHFWIIAIQAATTAGRQTAEAASRAKRIWRTVNLKLPSRTWLGITAVEIQIWQDQMHTSTSSDIYLSATNPPLDKFLRKRPHPAATFYAASSNKPLCKPDWHTIL